MNESDYLGVEAPEGAIEEVLWEWQVEMAPRSSRCQHIYVQFTGTSLNWRQTTHRGQTTNQSPEEVMQGRKEQA